MRILAVLTLVSMTFIVGGRASEAAPQSLPLPSSPLQKSSGHFYDSWCRCFYQGVQHNVPYPPSEVEHSTPTPWTLPDSSDSQARVAACCDYALYEQRRLDYSHHPNNEHFPQPVWTPHADRADSNRCERWVGTAYCHDYRPFNIFERLFQ
jgi:hypothetical protein